MPTILDVAEKANVSPSTVSLVANGNSRVADRTRQRVESVMDQLNWRGRAATKEKKRHIGIIYGPGMIVSGELVSYCCKWINGIRESFAEKNVDITASIGQSCMKEDLMFLHNMEHKELDGLVMMGVYPESGYMDSVHNENLPFVVMNQKPKDSEFSSVRANAQAGGRLAAEHLLNRGHRRIAVLISGLNHREPGLSLREGFCEILAEKNVAPIDPGVYPPLDFDQPDTFIPIAKQLIDAGATACFTGDPVALRLADALEKLGTRVPEDFSILGWDDLGFTTARGQQLSSIGYDKPKMGLLAGEMLQKLIQEDGRIVSLDATVPVNFNNGQTTEKEPRTSLRFIETP